MIATARRLARFGVLAVASTIVLGLTPVNAATDAGTACSVAATDGLERRARGDRTYELYVPSSLADLPEGTAVPLLTAWHGLGGSGSAFADKTGWASFAETHRFVVAFPDGVNRTHRFREGSEDVANARALVAEIASVYCIDTGRVFATGHSNGAYFAQRLACDAADLFASVTEYAGGRPEGSPFLSDRELPNDDGCSPSRPIAVGMFHGEDDSVIRVQEGIASRDAWAERLACGEPESLPTDDAYDVAGRVQLPDDAIDALGTSRGQHLRYACAGGVALSWRSFASQNHDWPGGDRGIQMQLDMWEFMNANA